MRPIRNPRKLFVYLIISALLGYVTIFLGFSWWLRSSFLARVREQGEREAVRAIEAVGRTIREHRVTALPLETSFEDEVRDVLSLMVFEHQILSLSLYDAEGKKLQEVISTQSVIPPSLSIHQGTSASTVEAIGEPLVLHYLGPLRSSTGETIGMGEIYLDISSVSQEMRAGTGKIFLSSLLSFSLFSLLLYLYSSVMLRRLEHDHRARERSEKRARELSDLARAGTLIAGLSHQLRNPIAILKGVVSALSKREVLPEQAPFMKALGEEVQRLGDLVEAFLKFAQPVSHEGLDHLTFLEPQLRAAADKVRKKHPSIQFEMNIPEGASTRMRPDLLHEVAFNLFDNSAEACPPDLTPLVTVNVTTDERHVILIVRDNGQGFPEDMLLDYKIAFKPFHTTKQTGTGLGLALIKRVIDEIGGTVDLSNDRGRGAQVKIKLPKGEEAIKED